MTKNSLSKWIEHSVKRELYGNIAKEEAIELLNILYTKILKYVKKYKYVGTKHEYNAIIKQIELLLSEYKTSYKSLLEGQIEEISETESLWVKDFMKELGKDIVIPTTILSSIKFSPVASYTNYDQLVNSSANRIKQSVDSSLRTAYLTKEGITTVTERMESRVGIEAKNVSTDVSTFNTTAFSITDYLTFKANKEKVRYVSILDSKTCIACSSYDSQIFESRDAPIIPLHENCRCILIPEEVEGEYETYSEWFEEQSEEVKKEILGKSRYRMYKNDGIKVSEFTNNGQIIPLKKLNFSKN